MKKIFYLMFFVSLCFLFNNDIMAAEGYCEYSLTNFKSGNSNYQITSLDENGVKLRLKIDTSNKGKVNIEWISKLNHITKTETKYQIFMNNGSLATFVSNLDSIKVYSSIVSGNSFTCPNLYAQYYQSGNPELYIFSEPISTGFSISVQLNLLGQKKPTNLEDEKIINECGAGIIDPKFGLSEKMSITFKKYTNRNEVCINYFDGANFCKNFTNQDRLEIVAQSELINRTFRFEKKDLEKIFSKMTASNNNCQSFWIDNSEQASNIYNVTLEKPENGLNDEFTQEDYEDIKKSENILNGDEYIRLLGQLKMPLLLKYPAAGSLKLEINGRDSSLKSVDENNELCEDGFCNDPLNLSYAIEKGIKQIRNYCNNVYSSYASTNNKTKMDLRMHECISFNSFYNELVSKGYINNLANDCNILSEDLKEKLVWILDILKIAGPMLAIGLGTLDFIKVIANGDADKEMKTALKRFGTRIIAAVLLFLIPFILAFLMDMFLKNKEGYDPNNPFCIEIDWTEE